MVALLQVLQLIPCDPLACNWNMYHQKPSLGMPSGGNQGSDIIFDFESLSNAMLSFNYDIKITQVVIINPCNVSISHTK